MLLPDFLGMDTVVHYHVYIFFSIWSGYKLWMGLRIDEDL
jgi:hypothetical protein